MLADLMEFLVQLGKKLQSIWYWFTDKLHDVGVGLWNWVVDSTCYAIENLMVAIKIPDSMFGEGLAFTGLPTQVVYILNQIHLGTCLAIIISAIMVRVTLNLIPGVFTRV